MERDLEFEPGTKHAYSNTNYIILGMIAELVTQQSIGSLFQELLFDSFGLDAVALVPFMDPPNNLINGYVHHYALSLKEWYVHDPDNTSWATIGFTAGAMVSTTSDLSAFTFHLFNGDIISEQSLEQMTSFDDNYGLGIFEISLTNVDVFGHEGEITGFESITAIHPESKIVVSISSNTTPFDIYKLLGKIYDELL
jgi:D-alanyl-D-alanine carboxypeptidase